MAGAEDEGGRGGEGSRAPSAHPAARRQEGAAD